MSMEILRCPVEMSPSEDIYIVRVTKDEMMADPDIHALVQTLNTMKTRYRRK